MNSLIPQHGGRPDSPKQERGFVPNGIRNLPAEDRSNLGSCGVMR
jgi:hypothetical protein